MILERINAFVVSQHGLGWWWWWWGGGEDRGRVERVRCGDCATRPKTDSNLSAFGSGCVTAVGQLSALLTNSLSALAGRLEGAY